MAGMTAYTNRATATTAPFFLWFNYIFASHGKKYSSEWGHGSMTSKASIFWPGFVSSLALFQSTIQVIKRLDRTHIHKDIFPLTNCYNCHWHTVKTATIVCPVLELPFHCCIFLPGIPYIIYSISNTVALCNDTYNDRPYINTIVWTSHEAKTEVRQLISNTLSS